MNLTITNHAIERFKERFLKNYPNVKNNASIYNKIKELLSLSKENRSFLNNSLHMISLYEKYGYDQKFKLMCVDGITFVLITNEEFSKEYLVTCYSLNDDKYMTKHNKFSGKKKSEEEAKDIIPLEEVKKRGWNIGL